jgi:hypothetical protein
MPIVKDVEIHWLVANPQRGKFFQNKTSNPEKWSVQMRIRDKALRDSLTKEFGFKFTTEEDDNGGGNYYKTNLSAYTRDQEGNLNKPINVILANGDPIDPDTVGNGSVANISFRVSGKGADATRRLTGVQVTKWKVYKNEDEFELSDDFETIDETDSEDNESIY